MDIRLPLLIVAGLLVSAPLPAISADDEITIEKLDKLNKNDFDKGDWDRLQTDKTRIKDAEARLEKLEVKDGAEAGILSRRIEESKKRISALLKKNKVSLDGKESAGTKKGTDGGGKNVTAGPPPNTTSLPLLVNLQGFSTKAELDDAKKRIRMNVDDANKVLEQNAKTQGKKTGLSLGPIEFEHNPKGPTHVKQGTKEFRQMQRDGEKELTEKFGKNKGSKLFIVQVLRKTDGSVPSGLGTNGARTAFFPDGDFSSDKEDENTRTFGVLRLRGGGDELIDVAQNGHFLIHELIHNSGLTGEKHEAGTIFAETLDFGEPGKRKGHRTISPGQWDSLENFFKKYGNAPISGKQSSLLSEPGDSRYAAGPGATTPNDSLATAWGGSEVNFGADGLYQSGGASFPADGSLALAPVGGPAFTNAANASSLGRDPWIGVGSDALNVTSEASAIRAPGIQLMIVLILRFRVPGNPVGSLPSDRLADEATTGGRFQGFLSSFFGLLSRRPGGRRASYGLGVATPRFARAQTTPPKTPGPPLKAKIRALGVSTGEAFTVDLVNNAAYPIDVSAAGVVVEALSPSSSEAVEAEFQAAASGKNTHEVSVNGYCLEFLQQPPPAGTVFRVSAPQLQEKFQPMRSVLRAGQKLFDVGGLTPDSDPKQYFHSIVQWALWSKEKGFNVESFGSAFLERTKKNFDAANQPWTKPVEDAVRALVPNRWKDVEKILREAATLDAAPSR